MINAQRFALIEGLKRKLQSEDEIARFFSKQFITDPTPDLHPPFLQFQLISSRNISPDEIVCSEMTVRLVVVTDGILISQSHYILELVMRRLQDRKLLLDLPVRCVDLWIEKLEFARANGPSNHGFIDLKAIVETI
jgi:hypothetical protein